MFVELFAPFIGGFFVYLCGMNCTECIKANPIPNCYTDSPDIIVGYVAAEWWATSVVVKITNTATGKESYQTVTTGAAGEVIYTAPESYMEGPYVIEVLETGTYKSITIFSDETSTGDPTYSCCVEFSTINTTTNLDVTLNFEACDGTSGPGAPCPCTEEIAAAEASAIATSEAYTDAAIAGITEGVATQDDGVGINQATTLNFTGAGVVVTDSGGGIAEVAIAGGGGSGDVTAAANLADNTIIRGDGGLKGVQDSGITIDDSDNISGINNVTGADTNFVTGTAGVSGNLTQWNVDGDAVDSGVATSSLVTATSATNFTNKTGNISQWTNDSAYITASSADNLTNKTGNISQWTNDSGYVTSRYVRETWRINYTSNVNPVASTTYYISPTHIVVTGSAIRQYVVPANCTLIRVQCYAYVNGTIATNQAVTVNTYINGSATTTVTNTWTLDAAGRRNAQTNTLSDSLTAGDTLALQMVNPAWGTTPTNVDYWFILDFSL